MLFYGLAYSNGAKYASPDFQVPAVKITTADGHSTIGEKKFLDIIEPLLGCPPVLAPDPKGLRPRERNTKRPTPVPGSEAIAQASPQARQGLNQV